LATLPPEGVEELGRFLDLLSDKYQGKQTGGIAALAALGGLWQEIPFEVEDEEIRALRRRITENLSNKS
jgi:hypothetical protein